MGLFDMGEGDASFGEGMSEMSRRSEAEERQELLRMQQAGQQQAQRQSASQRARAMQQHAANLKKKADLVRKMRNLRYLRVFGCCMGSSCSTMLLILISIIVVFSFLGWFVSVWEKTKEVVSGVTTEVVEVVKSDVEAARSRMTDAMCWVSGNCNYDPNAK